jgi:hypothetical protein
LNFYKAVVALRPLSTRLLAAILVAVGATRLAVVAVERQEGVAVAHLGGAIVAHPSRASLGGAKSASRRGIVLQPVGIALMLTMSLGEEREHR